MSGFNRFELSLVTGPRLLKPASVLFISIAPVENDAAYMAGGSLTVEQPEPLLPADASTKMPAACVFSTIVWSVLGAQPSLGGQVQLLLMTSGRKAGLGFCPFKSVGAMKNWKHSV
jgi:hypothetical protein